ncbi:uncharacterized protein N7479_010165 [Penicillium vulpinum]|uniref:Xylose isomerase-like TIM barrel domain-containing protein n=1 Tax=Penicillium vulpinum TaxID=29845 RepID=A0A1V6RVY8_9EURO|nr:uncharacterized protein N7479_010165 [Penicillium vulpinum]KAJ5951752.1 hypothetical protein N7479_010165 [Penicillium vulpinum]OQE05664.1 hypothetical protein PENVUL_c023G05284 [Penicillium vulpinum]
MAPNKLAIASVSLSQYPGHILDHKIRAASQAGIAGIEIVYSDLLTYSKTQNISIQAAAQKIHTLCLETNLQVLSLAPFENYEGATTPLKERLALGQHWLEIARLLHAPYLQIPSIYTTDCSRDEKTIISDLQRLSDLASSAKPVVSIAYEPLSWGTNCSTWEGALSIVQRVERANFGLCLDTFHEGTKLWGDNASPSGMQMDAEVKLRDSLRRFVRDCPRDKIFYVQLSDAERFETPYSLAHPWALPGEAKEFTWSKHARPFPLEVEFGAYLPVVDIARAWIVDVGFEGWISMETFDRRMVNGQVTPEMAAKRAVESWRKVQVEIESKSRL